MAGLLVFGLIGLYAWGAYKIVRRVNRWWGKLFAISIVILVPTADAVYGRVKLKQMCEVEGGLKIYRVVSGVKGFYFDGPVPDDEWITKHGLEFVEGKDRHNQLIRKERSQISKVVLLKGVPRKSDFALGRSTNDLTESYQRVKLFVYELSTGEKIATLTNITFRGGWSERLLAGILAATPKSKGCALDSFGDVYLFKSTFRG